MSDTKVFEPPKSKLMKFRVLIQQPELWKVQAIADYKRRKYIAAKNSSHAGQTSASMQQLRESRKTKRSNSISNPSQMDTPKASGKLDMTPAQREAAMVQTIKELEIIDHNSKIMQARIAALHNVKISLLWLLKKATLHERNMIHENGYVHTNV